MDFGFCGAQSALWLVEGLLALSCGTLVVTGPDLEADNVGVFEKAVEAQAVA